MGVAAAPNRTQLSDAGVAPNWTKRGAAGCDWVKLHRPAEPRTPLGPGGCGQRAGSAKWPRRRCPACPCPSLAFRVRVQNTGFSTPSCSEVVLEQIRTTKLEIERAGKRRMRDGAVQDDGTRAGLTLPVRGAERRLRTVTVL